VEGWTARYSSTATSPVGGLTPVAAPPKLGLVLGGGGTGSAAEATSGQWVVGGAVEGGLWRGGEEEDDVGVSRYGYRMMGCR
jgi:hypothetical protein